MDSSCRSVSGFCDCPLCTLDYSGARGQQTFPHVRVRHLPVNHARYVRHCSGLVQVGVVFSLAGLAVCGRIDAGAVMKGDRLLAMPVGELVTVKVGPICFCEF